MIGMLTKPEIEELLEDNIFGHLGCNDGHNSYVYSANYVYNGTHIICHSQNGFKNRVMRKNGRVCFQVDAVTDHSNWKSVLLHGNYEEVHEIAELKKLINAFYDRRLFIKRSKLLIAKDTHSQETGVEAATRLAIIFKILIDESTGFFERS